MDFSKFCSIIFSVTLQILTTATVYRKCTLYKERLEILCEIKPWILDTTTIAIYMFSNVYFRKLFDLNIF